MSLTYVALVHRDSKEGAVYIVVFPDFATCVFGGATIDEALENARDGLLFHIEGLLNNGEKLPEPQTLEVIKASREHQPGVPTLVRITPPTGRLRRLNISMDTGLLTEIDHAAKMAGKNRSQFLVDAARQVLA
jgi:predicted RNase H-like HicB family nuclease